VIRYITISLLLASSVWIARYALSDFYYQRVKTSYSAVDFSSLRYARELSHFIDEIDKSLSLRPTAANSLDLKADLLYQSWWLSPDGQYFQDSKQLQAAAALHNDALQIRKNWVFSIARLALIYSHQAELDEQFDYWFTKSHKLGLYETAIAKSLMQLGLNNWDRLNLKQQSITLDFVASSIEKKSNSAKAMELLLNRYDRLSEVCKRLPNTPRKLSVCKGQ